MVEEQNKDIYIYSKAFPAKLSSQNQITVPAEVRETIGVEPGDKIVFVLDENQKVTIQVNKKESLLDLYGSMLPKGNNSPMDWDDIRIAARQEKINPKEK